MIKVLYCCYLVYMAPILPLSIDFVLYKYSDWYCSPLLFRNTVKKALVFPSSIASTQLLCRSCTNMRKIYRTLKNQRLGPMPVIWPSHYTYYAFLIILFKLWSLNKRYCRYNLRVFTKLSSKCKLGVIKNYFKFEKFQTQCCTHCKKYYYF